MIGSRVSKRGICVLLLLLCAFAQTGSAAEWQSDWENTLAVAKKEGKVAVITDVTAAIRDALTIPFQEKYSIEVNLFGALGREIPPRILAERKAGHYLWDVFVHGTTTGLESMIPMSSAVRSVSAGSAKRYKRWINSKHEIRSSKQYRMTKERQGSKQRRRDKGFAIRCFEF